jgi:site-specific recombinase XerD
MYGAKEKETKYLQLSIVNNVRLTTKLSPQPHLFTGANSALGLGLKLCSLTNLFEFARINSMKGEIGLKQAIVDYRDIYLAYRNFAQRTRVEYVNDLEDLVKYIDGIGVHTAGEVELPHLVRYIAELEKRGFAGSTRKRKTISIRSFLSFLHMEGHILTDIGKRLIPPYVEAQKPRFLTTEEISRLLTCVKGNKRDYAIIQLLLQTGIKLSELMRLTINDLQKTDLTDKNGERIEYIKVVGDRRNKGRVIPLNPEASSAIDDYLTNREKSKSDNLFINRSGEQLGKRGVEKVIGKYFEIAGIGNASVNSLRHTFGTLQVVKGTDLKTIQKVMGHKERRTTEIYLYLANQRYF